MATKLRGGFRVLAMRLQEAADAGDSLSANDIRTRLNDAINDQHRGSGQYAYLVDSFGDAESGDVIYCCDGEMYRAGYEMSGGPGAQKCVIDFEGADDVVPRTVYEVEADEGEHMAAMESARAAKLYADSVPLYERFVSKKERDSAGSGDFAGKGKSFPILKAADVSAAASSIGRAGADNYSTDVIRKNIIRIAKAKGWAKELPKAWQDEKTDAKEAATPPAGALKLVESAPFPIDIELREAFTVGKKIKLIAPGPGASAYYTEAALKQAVKDKIFHAGLPMRIDHPTRAEEAARPEGSVKDWGAVLATDAAWMDACVSAGKDQGPGLYSEIKPFSDHAQTIAEKGPYAGVSIRANGSQLFEAGRPVTKAGLPVLEKFTDAEGADMVTRAGAGGLFLQESARGAEIQTQESSTMPMDENELKLLREAVAANTAVANEWKESKLREEAIKTGARILGDVSLSESSKMYIIESVVERGVPKKDGALDVVKLTEAINGEARRYGESIGVRNPVTGMGAGAVVEITEAQRKAQADAAAAEETRCKEAWAVLTDGNLKIAEIAVKGRTA